MIVVKETKNQFHCQSGHLIAEVQGVMNIVCGPEGAGWIPLTSLFEGLPPSARSTILVPVAFHLKKMNICAQPTA